MQYQVMIHSWEALGGVGHYLGPSMLFLLLSFHGLEKRIRGTEKKNHGRKENTENTGKWERHHWVRGENIWQVLEGLGVTLANSLQIRSSDNWDRRSSCDMY